MTDLVLANSVQLTGHALVMLWLVNRLASLRGHGLGPTILKAIVAAAVMGVVLWLALPFFQAWLAADNLIAEITLVGILSLLGGGIYLLALFLLRTPELSLISTLVKRFLPKRGV
jgi:peptidoglycan biosynthesis protein MviN/MurJ (putative lipid II flippase)